MFQNLANCWIRNDWCARLVKIVMNHSVDSIHGLYHQAFSPFIRVVKFRVSFDEYLSKCIPWQLMAHISWCSTSNITPVKIFIWNFHPSQRKNAHCLLPLPLVLGAAFVAAIQFCCCCFHFFHANCQSVILFRLFILFICHIWTRS